MESQRWLWALKTDADGGKLSKPETQTQCSGQKLVAVGFECQQLGTQQLYCLGIRSFSSLPLVVLRNSSSVWDIQPMPSAPHSLLPSSVLALRSSCSQPLWNSSATYSLLLSVSGSKSSRSSFALYAISSKDKDLKWAIKQHSGEAFIGTYCHNTGEQCTREKCPVTTKETEKYPAYTARKGAWHACAQTTLSPIMCESILHVYGFQFHQSKAVGMHAPNTNLTIHK